MWDFIISVWCCRFAQQKREAPPQLTKLMSEWKETADKIKQIQAQSTVRKTLKVSLLSLLRFRWICDASYFNSVLGGF